MHKKIFGKITRKNMFEITKIKLKSGESPQILTSLLDFCILFLTRTYLKNFLENLYSKRKKSVKKKNLLFVKKKFPLDFFKFG